MFQINDDMSINVTRGDSVRFSVAAEVNGHEYTFKAGDVVRINVFEKKNCENVVLSKDFGIERDTTSVDVFLTQEETRIGDVINKPKDYWYEIELNPYDNPQTIIGYDDDGAKVFKLFPEGDIVEETGDIEEGDIPVVDSALSLTSARPVQNRVVTKNLVQLSDKMDKAEEEVKDLSAEISVERARIDMMIANEGYLSDDIREYILYDGKGFKVVVISNGVNAVFKAYGNFSVTADAGYSTLVTLPKNLEPFNGINEVSKNGVHFDFIEELVDEINGVWEWKVKYKVETDTTATLTAEYSLKNITVPNDEVEDIRVDVYGMKHTTAGQSVRSQILGIGKGLTDEQIVALDTMFKICAYRKNDISEEYEQFKAAFGIGSIEEDTGSTLIPATSIVLNKTSLTFTENESVKLTATTTPIETTDNLVWTSTNESVATVTNGIVKPISNGTAVIIATCGSVSAACSVTVNIAEEVVVTLSNISAKYTGNEVVAGTSLNSLKDNLTVTATYSDGTTATVTGYALSGSIEVGNNTITVSYNGKIAYFTVTGVATAEDIGRIPATSVTLNMDVIEFTDTVSQKLIATVEPSNTTDTVVWTSDNESVATVTEGIVKPIAPGIAIIRATAGSVYDYCHVDVVFEEEETVTLTGISAEYTGGSMGIGSVVDEIEGIIVTAIYSDGTIAAVNDYTLSGKIQKGSNVITVEYKGFTTTFTVLGAEGDFVFITTPFTFKTSSKSVIGGSITHGQTIYYADAVEIKDGQVSLYKGSGGSVSIDSVKLYRTTHENYDASKYEAFKGKYVGAGTTNGTIYFVDENATYSIETESSTLAGTHEKVTYTPTYKVAIKED